MPWKTITDLLADRLLRIYTTFSALLGVNWTYAVPLRSPPSANLMNTFLPLELAPSVMGNAVGEPELPAEESGVIIILVEEGNSVSVGDVVCIIDTSKKQILNKRVRIFANYLEPV